MRTVKFKKAGDSLTLGNQRFDDGNITPAIYDALVAMDEKNADHFEVLDPESKDDKIGKIITVTEKKKSETDEETETA